MKWTWISVNIGEYREYCEYLWIFANIRQYIQDINGEMNVNEREQTGHFLTKGQNGEYVDARTARACKGPLFVEI